MSKESSDFNFDPGLQLSDRMFRNFYDNGCYNFSLHPQQYFCIVHCNNPEGSIPYPIPPPVVSCYVSGYDGTIHLAKYETDERSGFEIYDKQIYNETYYDEGISCRGHFCFIVPDKYSDGTRYYKGCISANEQGENRIQLGYMYLNDVPYYICNTDFCNFDIETTLEEARNGTLEDNFSSLKLRINVVFMVLIAMNF
uniref:ApeC domain-containing protein n=1 Tax=Caenorhabditis tropicalis TaxID=1561998 RepID=A0A1I7SY71_9PELO